MKSLALAAVVALTACGMQQQQAVDTRDTKDMLASAHLEITPDSTGTMALPAPQSMLRTEVTADVGTPVIELADVEINEPNGLPGGDWRPSGTAYVQLNTYSTEPGKVYASVTALKPARFRLVYATELDGVRSPPVERKYCVGD